MSPGAMAPGMLLLAALLLQAASAAVPASLPPAACWSLTQLQLAPSEDGSSQATLNATLAPGCQQVFYLAGDACDPSSFLVLELWDLEQAGVAVSEAAADPARAQPFLVAARGQAPQILYNASSSVWSSDPADSLSDAAGQSIMRPYLMVQDSFGAAMGPQAAPPPPGCSSDLPCWYATVLNSHPGGPRALSLQFRATCAPLPRCPEPDLGAGPCSGNGQCQASVSDSYAAPACACVRGWGDIGCNQPLLQLRAGAAAGGAPPLPPGQWRYFSLALPPGAAGLSVELERTRGDPVLFLKGVDEGIQPGALPSVLDSSRFADRASWRERSNRAQILRSDARPGPLYVAVLNSEEDIAEPANFSLRARFAPPGSPLCPWACNGRGRCGAGGVCACDPGFGGRFCQGTLAQLAFEQPRTGGLQPGSWAYYVLDLSAPAARREALRVQFRNDAGQGILIAAFGAFPTLLAANFKLRTSQLAGPTTQVIQPHDLAPEQLIFGIYNMDYYVHAPFTYSLTVSQAAAAGPSYASWISVIIAVSCSVLVAACIYAMHRVLVRRRAGARGRDMLRLWRPLPVLPVAAPEQQRRAARRGLDPTVVQSFPVSTYDVAGARGGSQTPAAGKAGEDETVCSVCLFGYEDGELVRTLPCGHAFHCDCIDQWLRKRSTCPMCRVSLAPGGDGGAGLGERAASGETAASAASLDAGSQPAEAGAAPGGAAARGDGQHAAEGSGRPTQQEAAVAGAAAGASGRGEPAAGGAEARGAWWQRGWRRPRQQPAPADLEAPGRRRRQWHAAAAADAAGSQEPAGPARLQVEASPPPVGR